jgi:DNA-binding response OmpR family regulator
MRMRPARVAIVDDDVHLAVTLDAALAVDERAAVHRFGSKPATEELLGALLAWRADVVVLDPGLLCGRTLARSLRACGVEVVLRLGPLAEVEAAVRGRFAALRGRPAPPATGVRRS